jgi:hypothetical protein
MLHQILRYDLNAVFGSHDRFELRPLTFKGRSSIRLAYAGMLISDGLMAAGRIIKSGARCGSTSVTVFSRLTYRTHM